MFSQPVLLALVAGGLTRDDAYRIVQRNAMRAWDERRDFRSLLEADPDVERSTAVDVRLARFDLDRARCATHRRACSRRSAEDRAEDRQDPTPADAGALEHGGVDADLAPRV